jgi:hypothetical protein
VVRCCNASLPREAPVTTIVCAIFHFRSNFEFKVANCGFLSSFENFGEADVGQKRDDMRGDDPVLDFNQVRSSLMCDRKEIT